MRQDQRLLIVLALAWRQLEHQIKSLAALTEADRREFIRLLGGVMPDFDTTK
jgi:DNA-binding transcriptional regulator/RsmH inhibitor MraZ